MYELERCPFCGGSAFAAQETQCFYGKCFECGSTGEKQFYVFKEEMQQAYEKAVNAWNRRADNG